MRLEEIKEDIYVFDEGAPEFGEGIIMLFEDNIVTVYYEEIEEVISYSKNEAINHLNVLL